MSDTAFDGDHAAREELLAAVPAGRTTSRMSEHRAVCFCETANESGHGTKNVDAIPTARIRGAKINPVRRSVAVKPRVGLVANMAPGESWPEEIINKVRGDHRAARTALEAVGMEVVSPADGLSRTPEDMRQHGRFLRNENVEVLVVYVGTWTHSRNVVALASMVGVPVIIWTYSSPGNIGIVGGSISRGALDEVGITNTLIYGDFSDERTQEKLRTWCTGYAAATRLRGTTLGVGGSRSMGMYTTHVDPSELRKKFGIDVEGWDQGVLIEDSKRIPDSEASAFLSWMKEQFGDVSVGDDVMLAQIKMYLAMKKLVRNEGFDFVCVRCMPELPSYHTTFCLAHAFLNDRFDEQGEKEPIVCGCEVDINGTITMQMLKNITGAPVMFGDFLLYDEKQNIATLCNCGSMAVEFATGRKDVKWVEGTVAEFDYKLGCASPQYVAKPGKVTMARLGRINGEYIMLIMGGEAVSYPRSKLEEVNPNQPQAFVKLDCSPDAFIAQLRANHIHLVYGNYISEMEVLCGALGIRPIIP